VSIWAVIPVKRLADGKSRLSAALAPDARIRLVQTMAAHVVAAAQAAPNIDHVCIVGPERLGLPGDIERIDDPGEGLNAALSHAVAALAERGATRIVAVAGDLPQVTGHDIALLAAAPDGEIAIAPDRHGTGTNALSLPLPQASDYAFTFGRDSFSHHHGEAERLGLAIETIHSLGLERDIDEPPDLADAIALLEPGKD
jgi:2-phospho-L-lactate guanylyltransferase